MYRNNDIHLIWERYLGESCPTLMNENEKVEKVKHMLDDLVRQKKKYYPETSEAELRDTSIEDLESQFQNEDDQESLYILQQLSQPKPDDDFSNTIYRVDLSNGHSQQLFVDDELQQELDYLEKRGHKKVGGLTVWMSEEFIYLKTNKH